MSKLHSGSVTSSKLYTVGTEDTCSIWVSTHEAEASEGYTARYDEDEVRHHYEHPSGSSQTLDQLGEWLSKFAWDEVMAFPVSGSWAKLFNDVASRQQIGRATRPSYNPILIQPSTEDDPETDTAHRPERNKGWYRKHDRHDRDPHRQQYRNRKAA